MKLLTHISAGLFLGTLFYYFLGFNFDFVLLAGFSAFLPDIDWRMQYSLKIGGVHRKFLHNVWVTTIVVVLTYWLFHSVILSFGIIIGFISHLIADSFTVQGVYWLYPLGKDERKYFCNGPLTTGFPIEKYVQMVLFGLSGFLFLAKQTTLEDVFSIEGMITIVVIVGVGVYLYRTFARVIKRAIRGAGL